MTLDDDAVREILALMRTLPAPSASFAVDKVTLVDSNGNDFGTVEWDGEAEGGDGGFVFRPAGVR